MTGWEFFHFLDQRCQVPGRNSIVGSLFTDRFWNEVGGHCYPLVRELLDFFAGNLFAAPRCFGDHLLNFGGGLSGLDKGAFAKLIDGLVAEQPLFK